MSEGMGGGETRTSPTVLGATRYRLRRVASLLAEGVERTRAGLPQWVPVAIARRRRALGLALPALVVLGALAWHFGAGREEGQWLLTEVREGPLEVRLVETGTLQALRSVTYSSSLPGNQAKIVYLVAEGATVKEGDLLIGFDPSPFAEEIRRSEAQLAQAGAELVKTEQDLKLQDLENQERMAESRSKLRSAELELASVTEGKGKLAEAESEAAVATARLEVGKAASNYEDLKPLLAEGFITQLELDRARQELEKARETLKLLETKHRAFVDYTRPAEVEQARAQLSGEREAQRSAEQEAAYRLSQARASREIASSRRAELEAKLLEAGKHLAACEVRATVSGLAIYQKVFFGSEHRKIQVGDQVWPNQPLIMLPELAQMVVETRVRETDVHKVEKNQEVAVRVDAYPGLQLGGSVSFIGTLAQEERRDGGAPGSGKYFQVTVELEGTDPRLRPGMSARVELVVEKVESARFVPLEAVFERGGRYFCLVVERGQPRPREVLTGTSNEHFIVIEAGLDPGERVLMGDPRGSEAAPVIERGFELPSPLTPE